MKDLDFSDLPTPAFLKGSDFGNILLKSIRRYMACLL